MVAFVEVLVVWSRFWRIYERGFVDLVEGTTKRMALLFGRKTIGENLILETSIVVVIRLSWKAIFQTCRNNNSKCKPFQTRNKTISNSLRDSFRANILANHQLSLKYQHKKKKGKKNPQRIENELEPTCQSLRKISCPSTQSSRHSKQSDAAPPIVRLCPATVSQSSPICACENEADRKKIRDRIRIKITLPLLLVRPIISAVSVGSWSRPVIIEGPRWEPSRPPPPLTVGTRWCAFSIAKRRSKANIFHRVSRDWTRGNAYRATVNERTLRRGSTRVCTYYVYNGKRLAPHRGFQQSRR